MAGETMAENETKVEEAAARLRTVDSYGFEWANLLQDRDTDPQMLRDVVAVVREYLRLTNENPGLKSFGELSVKQFASVRKT